MSKDPTPKSVGSIQWKDKGFKIAKTYTQFCACPLVICL